MNNFKATQFILKQLQGKRLLFIHLVDYFYSPKGSFTIRVLKRNDLF
jgi:hypothetical protein